MSLHPLPFGARLCAFFVASATASFAAVTPPKPLSTVAPEHPPQLLEKGEDGHAKVTMRIDATGKVTEVAVVEASNPAFGEAAVAAAGQWTFEPAIRDGAPVAIKVAQEFKFSVPVEKKLEVLAGRPVYVAVTGETIAANKLAARPTAKIPARAVYPKSLAGSGKKGLVRVKFVITTEGVAVNPEIVASEGEPVFSSYALMQVLRARWEPVKHEGRLVNVAMTLPMRFDENPPQNRPGGGGGGGGPRPGGEGGGGGDGG